MSSICESENNTTVQGQELQLNLKTTPSHKLCSSFLRKKKGLNTSLHVRSLLTVTLNDPSYTLNAQECSGGVQNCKRSITPLCVELLYGRNLLIAQRLSRLLSISFLIRTFRAARMAASRMFFSATRSTTFSGLSSFRNRGHLKELHTGNDQRAENTIKRNRH